MTPTILCAVLASGLAVALARENRVRRALQDIVARLLDRIRSQAGHQSRHTHSGGFSSGKTPSRRSRP